MFLPAPGSKGQKSTVMLLSQLVFPEVFFQESKGMWMQCCFYTFQPIKKRKLFGDSFSQYIPCTLVGMSSGCVAMQPLEAGNKN